MYQKLWCQTLLNTQLYFTLVVHKLNSWLRKCDAVDAPDAPYAQWRIIGSTHIATQTREPPRQEEQELH